MIYIYILYIQYMNNMTDPSWLLFLCGLPYHHDLVRAPEIETILRAASILLGPRILIHARYLIIWVHYVPSLSKSKYFTKLQLVEHKLGDIPVLNPPSPGPYIHSNYGGNIPIPRYDPNSATSVPGAVGDLHDQDTSFGPFHGHLVLQTFHQTLLEKDINP